VAMGGEADGGGCVDADKLIATIKQEFEMTIDIVALIAEVDEDGSGEIEFDEFKELLAGGPNADDDDEDD
jgi:Ca2+-binding EF-hand superfamily protein